MAAFSVLCSFNSQWCFQDEEITVLQSIFSVVNGCCESICPECSTCSLSSWFGFLLPAHLYSEFLSFPFSCYWPLFCPPIDLLNQSGWYSCLCVQTRCIIKTAVKFGAFINVWLKQLKLAFYFWKNIREEQRWFFWGLGHPVIAGIHDQMKESKLNTNTCCTLQLLIAQGKVEVHPGVPVCNMASAIQS